MALQSANHTVIRVVNTTQCHMIHQLVAMVCTIYFTVYNISCRYKAVELSLSVWTVYIYS